MDELKNIIGVIVGLKEEGLTDCEVIKKVAYVFREIIGESSVIIGLILENGYIKIQFKDEEHGITGELQVR